MRSFKEYWNKHGDVYAMEVAENAWDYQQSKVDELQKHKSLQELEINQISHANQQWQLKCSELQKRVDELHTAFKQLIEMENESISFEHDLFDKGWNQSARQTIENIYKLAGLGEQALKGGSDASN